MKKKLYSILFLIAGVICLISCNDDFLETSPTDKGTADDMFSTGKKALVPLNGIYRMMYTQGWSTTANVQQCDGLSAWNLAADVMGEDMVMKAQGSGWYWYDAVYNVKSRFTSSAWRSYDLWNGYYTLISNANYIINAESTMGGDESDKNYVIGQAYAIRAYCYHYLAMFFARTYMGHEDEPGIPLYTEPTGIGTGGNPRAKLSEVYKLIREDIDKAVTLLKDAPEQTDKTHIDYYVANGIKARICLTTNEWAEARDAAKEARGNYNIGAAGDLTSGMNDVNKRNVMWGAKVIETQTPGWGPFLYHMDAITMWDASQTSVYARSAPKCISIPLYNKMGQQDVRRQWWEPTKYSSVAPYLQVKFRFSNAQTSTGDKLWMRVEEMYLTEAEAENRLGNDAAARKLLEDLVKTRDPGYTTSKSGTQLGALTSDETGSLLEEILVHRRIELWGEYGRVFDIKRLKQGFTRTTAMGWPTSALITGVNTQNPETYAWVLTIPQAEFDGNESLDPKTDQNPVGDQP
ncbi:MAG: RagB/SusD family nutrient uptake outer membrane protein [Proteiniphilum sp.]|uniref:RagB/SusD family nutrient uptake outer membrane protein n=1 Tax=Proteiniphilum sp. TaxID=1926877 RepID=UPI002B206860|nr:RagB/SusD family nutrient uptake outer membrane protein [Proteiniphilum sp.]MEA5129116.1 RagB/SusD family nutrient uptake outer membrane protein [Proteiniphilum sp.]